MSTHPTLRARLAPDQPPKRRWQSSPWLILVIGLLWTFKSSAQPQWHSENIALLSGDDYTVAPEHQSTVTFEHVSGWAWGDIFGFVDITRFHHSDVSKSVYSEWNPRMSLSWLTERSWSLGWIEDVMIATTFEVGNSDVETLLIGPGTRLNIPTFDFFNLNLQYAVPHYGESRGWQLTAAWGWQAPLAGTSLLFEGYTDWVPSSRGENHSNFHFNPQLKVDIGAWLGTDPKHLYAGVEYDYWRHKYGIRDSSAFPTTQNTFSAMVQWKF